jgi:hypothetical protein
LLGSAAERSSFRTVHVLPEASMSLLVVAARAL